MLIREAPNRYGRQGRRPLHPLEPRLAPYLSYVRVLATLVAPQFDSYPAHR